jgi:hypothetical protein
MNDVAEQNPEQAAHPVDPVQELRKKSKVSNPLLERFNKMPPETFRMPSGGKLYRNGELDAEVVDGEVLVYPMTTVDELTMRSPDMLFQGTAVETVFTRCLPQIHKPMELFSNDVDYLLLCLRMVTYGETIEIYWSCPECDKSKGTEKHPVGEAHVVDVRAGEEAKDFVNVKPTYIIDLNKLLRATKVLDPDDPKFTVHLATGEVVKLRPSKFKEMVNLHHFDPAAVKTPDDVMGFITDGLLSVIQSVNGHTNKEHIKEWVLACEAPVLKSLQQQIHFANDWGTTQQYEFECTKCGYKKEQDIPLNPINFFTLPSTTPTSQ